MENADGIDHQRSGQVFPYDGIDGRHADARQLLGLAGLAQGDSLIVTQTAGAYDSRDTNAADVSTILSASNFTAGAGTLASDYVLPTAASGAGTILAKALTATILGDPTKTYDGTTAATLTPASFQLTGLVGSDSFTITQTAGAYDSKDTSAVAVGASLSPSDFSAGAGTPASDYALPATASGPGTILARTLTASIVGAPTKPYDGTTAAALTPANFQLSGLVPGETLNVTQTAGTYDSPDTNAATVNAFLSPNQLHGGAPGRWPMIGALLDHGQQRRARLSPRTADASILKRSDQDLRRGTTTRHADAGQLPVWNGLVGEQLHDHADGRDLRQQGHRMPSTRQCLSVAERFHRGRGHARQRLHAPFDRERPRHDSRQDADGIDHRRSHQDLRRHDRGHADAG